MQVTENIENAGSILSVSIPISSKEISSGFNKGPFRLFLPDVKTLMTELNVTAVASKDAGVNLNGVTSERWKPSSFFGCFSLIQTCFKNSKFNCSTQTSIFSGKNLRKLELQCTLSNLNSFFMSTSHQPSPQSSIFFP